MGMEIQVNSLEDMCDLMCNNYIKQDNQELEEDKKQKWYFTFGVGQPNEGHYITLEGSYIQARSEMCDKYGMDWGFQYSEEEWLEMENDPHRWWPLETPLEE